MKSLELSHSGLPPVSVEALGINIMPLSVMDSTKTVAMAIGGSGLKKNSFRGSWYPKSLESFPTNDFESCIG